MFTPGTSYLASNGSSHAPGDRVGDAKWILCSYKTSNCVVSKGRYSARRYLSGGPGTFSTYGSPSGRGRCAHRSLTCQSRCGVARAPSPRTRAVTLRCSNCATRCWRGGASSSGRVAAGGSTLCPSNSRRPSHCYTSSGPGTNNGCRTRGGSRELTRRVPCSSSTCPNAGRR